MKSTLVILTHVVHRAVCEGFLPAALELGYRPIIITDQGAAHECALPSIEILECDVFNPIAVIDLLTEHGISPAAVFSNSDHLQTSTALVAQAMGAPAKPWLTCYNAKNKQRMREQLARLGLPSIWHTTLSSGQAIGTDWPYPVVVKPVQGVASMNVCRLETASALREYVSTLPPGQTVLVEACMEGPLVTLETLGDSKNLHLVGGFDVDLSEPPHFVEMAARWNGPMTSRWRQEMLATIRAFGVSMGACHSEFIVTEQGPVLVEINYRSIGDNREFLLDRLVSQGWFKSILQCHLGETLPTPSLLPMHAKIQYLVASQAGRLVDAPKPENLRHVDYHALKQLGDHIQISHSNKDYLGVFTAVGSSEEDMLKKHKQALAQSQWRIV
ncbi:MAG TPA: siderophore biosynthesis protein PvsA [Limnobacter sp.]|nr:siderophore biosynthesis protein PvsA [Limnobacter sp.]